MKRLMLLLLCTLFIFPPFQDIPAQSVEARRDGPKPNAPQTASKSASQLLWDNRNINHIDAGIVSVELGGLLAGQRLINSADDFMVASGQIWVIDSIYAEGFPSQQQLPDSYAVAIYADNEGQPGDPIFQETLIPANGISPTTVQISLAEPPVLQPGAYWLSVYAVYSSGFDITLTRWNWSTGNAEIGSEYYLQDESGQFGGFNWLPASFFNINDPSALFALFGEMGGDDSDPAPPGNFTPYSDFNTPNEMLITWTDPATYRDGSPLTDFQIIISRDGSIIDSIAMGLESFTDTALTDGQLYNYRAWAKDSVDSVSAPVLASWIAGGSPIPSSPQNLSCVSDTVQAVLTWTDPATQIDGTPLDDLDSIRVYRNGNLIANIAPGVETFTDVPPTGIVFTYTVTAIDTEEPQNESSPSNPAECFTGPIPTFLVWVGPTAGGGAIASGDSILNALAANGEDALLTNNLFELGDDLSIYEGIFVVLGIFPNNHTIGFNDPEGPALEVFLANGGRLFLEGGDGFNFDPEAANRGYNIRPWFSLEDGPDGLGDIFGVIGVNDLSAFSFSYTGDNMFMDELQPILSTPVWQNDSNGDISGVFNIDFGGRAIGVVPAFGGFVNSSAPLNTELRLPAVRETDLQAIANRPPKNRLNPELQTNFPKKIVYSDKKPQRNYRKDLLKVTPNGIEIFANNKIDLMAAYLEFFRGEIGPPVISVNPAAITDTVFTNGVSVNSLAVSNIGNTLTDTLTFSITINPAEPWITVSPLADTLIANATSVIAVTLDASDLLPATYSTTLEIASNDPDNPLVIVPVEMVVEEAPVVDFSPDSMSFSLDPVSQDSLPMQVKNTGGEALEFTLTPLTGFSGQAKQLGLGKAKVADNLLSDDVKSALAARTAYRGQPNETSEMQTSPGKTFGQPDFINGEEIFGSTQNSFFGSNRDRGNIFFVTKSVVLVEHKMYLNIPTDTEIYFHVYEGDSLLGDFTKIHEVFFPVSGTGEGFYSSGKISVALNAGKYYLLGASWGNAQVTYFTATEEVPIPASFGRLETGSPVSVAGFPPGDSGTNTFEDINPYFCSVTTTAPLSVNPQAGTVLPGDSAQVWVTANSAGLISGDYNGAIQINSNDPLTPDTAMAVNFTVSSQPAIGVSPDSIIFDTLLIGQSQTLTFTISNLGTAELIVNTIPVPNPDFSTNPVSLTLPPLTSETVQINFEPTFANVVNEAIVISSNDPDTPQDSIFIHAVANDPPVAGLSPDSLSAILAPGQTATDTLQIINSGEGVLEFVITLEDATPKTNVTTIGDEAAQTAGIVAVGNPVPLSQLSRRQMVIENPLQDIPDSQLPSFVPNSKTDFPPAIAGEEVFGSPQTGFGPFGLRGRGNFFTVTESTNLLEHRLFLDIVETSEVWFIVAESESQVGTYTTISAANVSPQGPGEGWYSSGPISVPLEAGKSYMIFAQWQLPAVYYVEEDITPYPIPTSFGELTGGVGWRVASNPEYAVPPVDSYLVGPLAFGDAVAYYQTIVTGVGTDWLDVSQTEGTVPPNSSLDVIVSYDPLNLVGGDYFADVVVNSNDPETPEVRSSVQLTVIGLAGISADSVLFSNPVFVNDTDTTNLWIKNVGNGPLAVTGIASDNPVFTPAQTQTEVPPFDSLAIPIAFSPLELGLQTGTLTISSNDSMNPTIEVGVVGTAIPAPAISISPDSISETLVFGDSLDIPLVISNDGGSPLTWALLLGDDGNSKNRFGEPNERRSADRSTTSAERNCCQDNHLASTPQSEFKFEDEVIVEDGSFEAGSPNPFWNEASTNFGSPLCTLPVCGNGQGTGPRTGDWWCWLGGSSLGETGSVDQDVMIPFSRAAVLRFWLEVPSTNATGFMEVQVDDNVIFRITEADGPTYPEYTEIILDITDYADDEIHNIKFLGVTDPTPEGALNFFIDDISIEVTGSPFLDIIGETSGTIGSGDVSGVVVRLFALQSDTTFNASLLVNSNDPLQRSVRIPLALTVIDSVTGIEEETSLPTTFAVSPNFPNPFNPTTTIKYDIPSASDVKLIIYNILGQRIKTLVNRRKTPGRYNVIWDATNDFGNPVASGIYIYHFQADDFSRVRKMILLK